MSALADALLLKHADAIRHQGPRCGVETSGRASLVDALAARKTTMAAIARILEREAIPVSRSMVEHHVSGGCQCRRG